MATSPDASAPRRRPTPFAALQHRDFRLLWLGLLVSISGSQMQTAAIHWHIWMLTHSAFALGMIGLARLLPIVVLSLVGGVVADTRDRRSVLLLTQTAMALVAATLGLLTHLGLDRPWAIYGLTALSAAGVAFDNPARQALTPNLVPRERLANALTLNNILFQIATIVGPGLAGLCIASFGVGSVYWINAVSFLAVLVALARIRTPAHERAPEGRADLAALRDGLRFVRRSRIIFSTMLVDFLATFFASANTLLPVFATQILNVGPRGYGVLAGAQAMGSLVAGAVVSVWGEIHAKGRVLLVSVAVYGLATIAFGLSRAFVLSVLCLAVSGAGDTVSTILRSTLRQLLTPDAMRGRMTSINMIFFLGGPQLGEVEAGIAASLLGAPLSVVVGGIATLVLVAFTAQRVPDLRRYRDTPPVEASSAASA